MCKWMNPKGIKFQNVREDSNSDFDWSKVLFVCEWRDEGPEQSDFSKIIWIS
jgi:hypothetical protein